MIILILLHLMLRQCWVELHHGGVLGMLSLHSLATTRLDKKVGQNSYPKTVA